MDDLVAFVRQQLDEDERVALAANPAPWRTFDDKAHLDPLTIFGGSYMGDQEKLRNVASMELAWVKAGNAEHITRWDPARVLAEVEAKRRILDEHAPVQEYDPNGPVCSTCGEEGNPGDEDAAVRWPCRTVRLLAQPYAGREGWREEWRA